MSELRHRLDALARAWTDAGVPVEFEFAPGKTPTRPPETTSPGLRWPLPADLSDWFVWHDGAAPGRWGLLAPSRFSALSFAGALTERQTRLELAGALAEPDFPQHHYWERGWITLGTDQSGGSLVVDTHEAAAGLPVRTVEWADAEFRDVVANSLIDFVDVLVVAMENHTWSWDSERGRLTSAGRPTIPPSVSRFD